MSDCHPAPAALPWQSAASPALSDDVRKEKFEQCSGRMRLDPSALCSPRWYTLRCGCRGSSAIAV